MLIEIRFNNEWMKFFKRLLHWNKKFQIWYRQHWKNVFGVQFTTVDGFKCKPQHRADLKISIFYFGRKEKRNAEKLPEGQR